MKTFPIVLVLTLAVLPARAETISVANAGSHVGQIVTVEGTVSEVHTARSGKATFIDMGGSFPNNTFAGVIFAKDMTKVGDVSGLDGKVVDITGMVQSYQGRPEIVISSRDQIKAK